MEFKLNYVFQKPDTRDYKYTFKTNVKLPDTFSLKNKMNKILNQGNLGSCVSNAFAQYINMATNNGINISRLAHYFEGRVILGEASNKDTGLNIRSAATIIAKYGACLESEWPYVTSKYAQLPPLSAFKNSKLFKKYIYTFVNQDVNSLKNCLVTTKQPILFGFNVYSSFLTQQVATTGQVPTPKTSTDKLEGGHCMLIIGFNNTTSKFICVNSWGSGWGDKGLCYLSYDYLTNPNLASDFCSLTINY